MFGIKSKLFDLVAKNVIMNAVKVNELYQIGIRCLFVNKMKYSPFIPDTSVPGFF